MKLNIDTENAAEGWEYVGDVSVDTGRIIIADPCYLGDVEKPVTEIIDPLIVTDILEICKKHGVRCDDIRNNEFELKRVASLMRRFGEGQFPGGSARFVATETGYGDGRYPVYSKVEDSRVVGLWIDFECGKHVHEEDDD
jgi:hypothetical protein